MIFYTSRANHGAALSRCEREVHSRGAVLSFARGNLASCRFTVMSIRAIRLSRALASRTLCVLGLQCTSHLRRRRQVTLLDWNNHYCSDAHKDRCFTAANLPSISLKTWQMDFQASLPARWGKKIRLDCALDVSNPLNELRALSTET